MTGFAIGPTVAALIWELSGYDAVLLGVGIVLVFGLAAIILARHLAPRNWQTCAT